MEQERKLAEQSQQGDTLNVQPLELPVFSGSTSERASRVIDSLRRLERPIQEGASKALKILECRDVRSWVHESVAITERRLPNEITYLDVTAQALDVEFEALFLAQHRALFAVEAQSSTQPQTIEDDFGDDCTVGGARLGQGSSWLVKNRDNVPDGRDIIAQHTDPAWGHSVVAHSNFGGPMAASSGVNTRGLGIVLTRTQVKNPPPGVHRGSLMSALLAQCSTVKEALDVILGVPHLGGTLILGDKDGSLATVELEPDAVSVEWAQHRSWLAKTNHSDARSISGAFSEGPDEYQENSKLRLATMQQTMVEATQLGDEWSVIEPWIARRMGIHEGEGAVCRHDRWNTLGTAIIRCDPPTLLTSKGPPCEGRWFRWNATS